jgi:hypothetical protein
MALFAGSSQHTGMPTPNEDDGPSTSSAATNPRAAYVEDGEGEDPIAVGMRHTPSYPVRPLGRHEDGAGQIHSQNQTRIHTYSDTKDGVYPKLSKPVELMRNSYDFVVLGSGYGGGIAASRMARATGAGGRGSVCVLERGKERWPGQYPATAVDALKEVHVTGEFRPGILPGIGVEAGDPTDMFHFVLGRGMNAVVGNGTCISQWIVPCALATLTGNRPWGHKLDERQRMPQGRPGDNVPSVLARGASRRQNLPGQM